MNIEDISLYIRYDTLDIKDMIIQKMPSTIQ